MSRRQDYPQKLIPTIRKHELCRDGSSLWCKCLTCVTHCIKPGLVPQHTPMFSAAMTPVKFAASIINCEDTFCSHAIWSKIPDHDQLHGMSLATDPVAQLSLNRDSPQGPMSALQQWAQQQGQSTLSPRAAPYLSCSSPVMQWRRRPWLLWSLWTMATQYKSIA